jgi:hypothetical protein
MNLGVTSVGSLREALNGGDERQTTTPNLSTTSDGPRVSAMVGKPHSDCRRGI